MNLILFIATISISFIVVRIGAIAFHLTGIEWSQAKFQALSCFSGTGFTTRESEMIVSHSQRRRIATILMILGNAGIVTLVATFANSIRADNLVEKIKIPFVDVLFPAYIVPLVNFVVILIALFVLFKLSTSDPVRQRLTRMLKSYLIKKQLVRIVAFEELLVTRGDYGIVSVDIDENSLLRDTTLLASGLRDQDMTVLAIESNQNTTHNPKADHLIRLGDRLICYGNLTNLRRLTGVPPEPPGIDSDAP